MSKVRLRRALTAAFTLGLAGLPVVAAHAATGDVALTPASAGTLSDQVRPVAGSGSALVYLRAATTTVGADPSGEGPVANPFDERVVVRSASGAERDLGIAEDDAGTEQNVFTGWSLAGSTLTAAIVDDDGEDTPTGRVAWWDIDSGAHGTRTLPVADTYRAAAPGAFLVSDGGDLRRVPTDGAADSDLGTPFAASSSVVSVASDADGFVVTSGRNARRGRFAAPGAFTTLAATTTSDETLLCTSLSAEAAGCYASNDHEDTGYLPDAVEIVPLDGSAATRTDSCADEPAVVGTRLFFGCYADPRSTLATLDAGSSTVTRSTTALLFGPVAALGKAVVGSPDSTSLIAATTATDASTLVAARKSPVTVGAFALARGRVVDSEDEPVGGASDAPVSIVARPVHAAGSGISTAAASRVASGTGSTQPKPRLLAASKSVLVYATDQTTHSTVTLHVVGPRGTSTLTGAIAYGNVVVSDDRVLFQRFLSADGGTRVELFDASTGTTTTVRTLRDRVDSTRVTLSHHYLAYATKTGSVYREDLDTGRTVKLQDSYDGTGYIESSVYAYGDYVGWHQVVSLPHEQKVVDRLRNARTLSRTVTLPRTLWSLTDAGALLDDDQTSLRPDGDVPFTGPTTFGLRSYSGRTTTVLTSRRFLAGPQISDGVLAWVDRYGRLQARAL